MEPGLWMVMAVLVSVTGASPSVRADDEPKPFSLEEVISGELTAKGFNGTWVSGYEVLFLTTDGHIALFNVENENTTVILDKKVVESLKVSSFTMSADKKYLLLSYDTQAGFRHSSTAKYIIYNAETSQEVAKLHQEEYLQLVVWAPVGSSLAYVYKNNIFYVNSIDNNAITSPQQLTKDGEEGIIYNGVPDWVYEEEVLSSGCAMWFSPDAKRLVWFSFNDTLVQQASYMHYGTPGDRQDQYSKIVSIRYPKAGSTNPKFKVYLATLSGVVSIQEPVASIIESSDDTIAWDASWANNEEVHLNIMNRIQNESVIHIFNSNGITGKISVEESQGWLQTPHPVFNQSGENFVTIESWPSGASGKFSQLTMRSRDPDDRRRLTDGNSVVTNIYGLDDKRNTIYYQGTMPSLPSRRHVYSVSVTGDNNKCLSCDVPNCEFASAAFSTNLDYYALTCSSRSQPAIVQIHSVDNKTSPLVWQQNEGLRAVLSKRLMPKFEDILVDVEGGYQAHVRLWLPPSLNTDSDTKYPMVVYVYGGPGSQQITDAFTLGWGAYLVTNRGYIYALIDGRGSANKGDDMLFEVYKNLGTKEVDDQINVTKALQNKYSYIDAKRTSIWGWSYGGYATAMALARDTEGVFKCGISVAPVTSWIYYDSIYTERYMGLPDDNPTGYNNSDITRLAEKFINKEFFLMHGNADDNVHYQQAMVLARALEMKNVLFSQQSYPDENHRIGSVLSHVYRSQDKFWERCFAKPEAQTSESTSVKSSLVIFLILLAMSTVIV